MSDRTYFEWLKTQSVYTTRPDRDVDKKVAGSYCMTGPLEIDLNEHYVRTNGQLLGTHSVSGECGE